MARQTVWHRFRESTIEGTSVLWNNGPGFGSFSFLTGLAAGVSIRRVKLEFFLRTTMANVSGSGELPVGYAIEQNQVAVGVWTDMYNIGGSAPDPGSAFADPGWLMLGQMVYDGPWIWPHGGLVQEAIWNWRLDPTEKWDVERNAGPVPIGMDASVFFAWHNYTDIVQSMWNTNVAGVSIVTAGTMFLSVLTTV